jgi:hypothetical protein
LAAVTLQWLCVDLLTGGVICEAPTLIAKDPFRRTIGRYETQTVDLIIDPFVEGSIGGHFPGPYTYPGDYPAGSTPMTGGGIDPSWLRGTLPRAAALIAYRGDPGYEVIHWGGIVLRRQRAIGSNRVTLTLATPECYLDRRYTGAYTTVSRDQNLIVSDLISSFVAASTGLPMTVSVVGSAGTSRQRTYNDYDDKTVYATLGELAGLLSGPEWTAHWTWARNPDVIAPILYVGNRIGNAAQPGMSPPVTFDSANLIEGSLDENFSTGMGANDVLATSSGQGLARPSARSTAATFDGAPRYEYRFQPATSIQDTLTLQNHADRALALLDNGTNTITLKATADAPSARLGVDWNIGDDIGYDYGTSPVFPNGLSGVARCIGYEADPIYTSPILYLPKVA